MYYWENDIYIMIPLSYNIFYRESLKNKQHIGVAKEFIISDGFFEELKNMIRDKGDQKAIALDLERINYPGKMFEELTDMSQRVIFYNVQGEILRKKLQENLPTLNWSQDENICVYNGMINEDIIKAYNEHFCAVYEKKYGEILSSVVDYCEQDLPLLLDSSGLYSNMYVNVKKLFLNSQAYYFVLYGMAIEMEKFGEFDSFISSSKNGAILASLLGAMLNKKVVHIQGVGPKYSMKFGNTQNEIKKGKAYVYVFDFICTGTELKVLSALINANDAYMTGGIGFAQFEGQNNEKMSFGAKIESLITTKKAGLNYKISGDQVDMQVLMSAEK